MAQSCVLQWKKVNCERWKNIEHSLCLHPCRYRGRNRSCWRNMALETSEMISSDAGVKDVANICIFVISLLTICVRGVTNPLLWEQPCLCHHCLRSNGHKRAHGCVCVHAPAENEVGGLFVWEPGSSLWAMRTWRTVDPLKKQGLLTVSSKVTLFINSLTGN